MSFVKWFAVQIKSNRIVPMNCAFAYGLECMLVPVSVLDTHGNAVVKF